MAHTDTYKLSYYYGQKYNTEFHYKLLEEITKENKILFMSRVNLLGEVFYILYDIHISELCNATIQDLVDYYSTEEVIDYYAGTKFPSIERCIPYVIELQSLIYTLDYRTSIATAFNALVFDKEEVDFFNKLMNMLNKYTPEDKLYDICDALEDYFRSMHKHIPSYTKENFDYDDVEDEDIKMITVLDQGTNKVHVYTYDEVIELHPYDSKDYDTYDYLAIMHTRVERGLEILGHNISNSKYMIHSKSDSPWKD